MSTCMSPAIGKILLISPLVINVPTRASLAVETKDLLFLWLAYLNYKSSVSKQISSPFGERATNLPLASYHVWISLNHQKINYIIIYQ